jgi:hypothetical protein
MVCEECGRKYKVPRWRKDKTRFCSRYCRDNAPNPNREKAKIKALKGKVPSNKLDPILRKAKDQFFNQRCAARYRRIKWKMTFEEWWKIWSDSGHWEKRGRRVGQYVMARFGDKGPYSVENVKIMRAEANIQEREAARGVDNGWSKLKEKDIREIRSLEGTVSRTKLGKRFGIHPYYVRDIQKRKSWSWLE